MIRRRNHFSKLPFDDWRAVELNGTFMRKLSCPNCKRRVFFENVVCENCGQQLVFDANSLQMEKLDEKWRKACFNRDHGACNWCVSAEGGAFCLACDLNHVVPDLANPRDNFLWRRVEVAKHRLVYDLLRLRLPVVSKKNDPKSGLWFDFLSDMNGTIKVMTGHEDGIVTINIAEADDVTREANRTTLHEPYRTLLGHFRHEVGHYYWDRLVKNGPNLQAFRAVFGDEREDYASALQRHYQNGPPADWSTHYVSAYASSHPWEDWAECFAHYLHIIATLDTAAVLPLALGARIWKTLEDAYAESDFGALVDAWLPLAESLNELNRSMGVTDAYPFVLSQEVIGKLHTVQMILQNAQPAVTSGQ